MMQGMPAPIELHHTALRLSLRPDLGGCIEGLWFHGRPVLRSCAPGTLTHVQQSACFPLVPFSNRLAKAQLRWNGTTYPLLNNHADEAHAIHGVGWQRPWQVLDAGDDFARLGLEHRSGPAWPFAFDALQTLRLQGDTLQMTLKITNQSSGDAPVGLGWHPYFVKRPGSQLQFAATGLWNMGSDKLPTTRSASSGLDTCCDVLDIDNCFDGWAGTARLHDPKLNTLLTSSVQRLVVYTQPSQDCIAIEPVSHVNNAMNSQAGAQALGTVILAAGQSWQASMAIQVARSDAA
jgi:aldose 1-epimerase